MSGAVINLLLIIPFLIMAFFLSRGSGAFLLAGYNTMSKSEKAKYDEVALCKFMGKMLYAISFAMLLFSLSEWLEMPVLLWIGIALMSVLIVFTLVYANTGNRFKEKSVIKKQLEGPGKWAPQLLFSFSNNKNSSFKLSIIFSELH